MFVSLLHSNSEVAYTYIHTVSYEISSQIATSESFFSYKWFQAMSVDIWNKGNDIFYENIAMDDRRQIIIFTKNLTRSFDI